MKEELINSIVMMLQRRGLPVEGIPEQLSTTQIYLDLTESDLEAAHRKFVV